MTPQEAFNQPIDLTWFVIGFSACIVALIIFEGTAEWWDDYRKQQRNE